MAKTRRETTPPSPTATKMSLLKRSWQKLRITPLVTMFMVKGMVAPTIAISIYQHPSVAANYVNFGFVMIVISITTVPILPRGQFLMNLFVSVFLTCFAASMVLLGQYAGIKARESTKPPGAPPDAYGTYNSSASVVNAIFLIINLFGINMVKAARPALYIPSIQFTIFIMIGFTYGPNQPTVHRMLRFVKELLYTFLTGQAIATGVSLLIIPVSSRKVFFAEATGLLRSFQGLLKAQLAFVESLEHLGMCAKSDFDSNNLSAIEKKAQYQQRSKTLKAAHAGILSLFTKLQVDVVFSQREMTYGYFRGRDIRDFYRLLRSVFVPIVSLSTIADISERLRHYEASEETPPPLEKANGDTNGPKVVNEEDEKAQRDWQELIRELHQSFEAVIQGLNEAITHVLILLQLVPVPKKSKNKNAGDGSATESPDIEKGAGNPNPGDPGFGDYFEKEISRFRETRTAELQQWAESKGLSSVFQQCSNFRLKTKVDDPEDPSIERGRRAMRQLNLVLYMEFLLYSTAKTILALVRFAEAKVEDGTLKRKRVVVPKFKTIYKWMRGLLLGNTSNDSGPLDVPSELEVVRLGDSLKGPRDPEHLPSKNAWQAFGDHVRAIPRALGSEPVQFGARVTIATMSVGIMAYLKNTHVFFIKQRVVWALIMISIGMKPTSGSAVFNLFCNSIFTVGGMVFAFINWYIVDGHTAGVIVFFALFMAFWFYWAARYPRFLIGIVAGALTQVLIIGYELQVRVLGIPAATATGQPFYHIYELAPYRLLTVLAGSFIAYVWTIFPVPITEGSILRRDLGRSLFIMAKYLSCVTATVDQRIQNLEGDMKLKASPGRQLQKVRGKLLDEQITLLHSMRQNLVDMDWEPPLGGDFPRATYTAIINEIQDLIQYLAVIIYASESFSNAHANSDPSSSAWLSSFAASRNRSERKSHKMTSTLALLAASIRNGQALPPYLSMPKQSYLSISPQIDGTIHGIEASNDILALRNVNEPGFRSLGVIAVASACATDALGEILGLVRELVGEVDFSFSVGKAKES